MVTEEDAKIKLRPPQIKKIPSVLEKVPVKKVAVETAPINQTKLVQKPSDFHSEVLAYFGQNKIKIIEETIIRKSSEMDFVVELSSAVGTLRYFVKAKSKKKVNDGDLSSVFIQGQTKRLPVMFLSKGELTKKAVLMLESEFSGMRFNII